MRCYYKSKWPINTDVWHARVLFRVVMKKEVHKKTVIRPDGQEETVIKEDSQIHQDSEPPEILRDSMQQIINQFMEDNPQVPMIPGEEAPAVDEGTEV